MTITTITSGNSTSPGYTVSVGDELIVLAGGSGADVQVLSGGVANFSGIDSGTTIALGGTVSLTGTESGVTIQAGGSEMIDAGTITGGQIYGFQEVLSNTTGAAISNETIQNGGTLLVDNKTNTVSATTVESGGVFAINGNATGADMVIAGGTIQLQSAKANLSGTLSFAGAGTLQETAIVSAGYGDLAVISGFGAGDVIDLTAIGSGAIMTSATSGSDEIITISGGSQEGASAESFTFSGTGGTFSLTTDSAGTGGALTGTSGSTGTISVPSYPELTSFTAGDIVISVVGDVDGSAAYTDNQAAPVMLEEIDPTTGKIVGELELPQEASGANSAFSGEYGSSSEGILELAGNGQSLVIAGYGVNAATFNAGEENGQNIYGNQALAQSTSLTDQSEYTPVARVIADISYTGTIDTSTALYNVFNTNNPRSVATVNGQVFYISGQGVKGDTTQGVFEATDGASSATSIDDATDTREVEIYNGALYVSTDSTQNNTSNIATFGDLPSAAASPAILSGIDFSVVLTAAQTNSVNAGAVGTRVDLSPEQYFFANATTLYVADGGAPKAGTIGDGGLQKWTLNPETGVWSLAYTLSAGLNLVQNSGTSGTTGLIGLSGVLNANGTVTFYATNATLGDLDPTYLYTITDQVDATTAPSGEAFTLVTTAAPDTNIRGIAAAPSAPTNVTVNSLTTSAGLTTSNGSTLTVATNGTITGAVILSGGAAYVSGSDSDTLLVQGGSEIIYSTGTVTGDNVYGVQVVGGTASGETVYYDGLMQVASGGSASDTTVDAGGALVVTGTASDTIIDGGTVVLYTSGAAVTGAVTFSGTGGMLVEAAIPGAGDGETAVISGFGMGDAIDLTQFSAGATQSLAYAGGDTVETVTSGSVNASFTFSGEYTAGAFELEAAGTNGIELVMTSTITGASTVSSGLISENATIADGGTIIVLTGGSLAADTILSGGNAVISGTDNGTTIEAGGNELVLGTVTGDVIYGTQLVSGSTALVSGETVYNGGSLDLFLKGGTVDNTNLLSGGALYISGNALGENLTIDGGSIVMELAKATLAGGIVFTGAGTIDETALISATYGDSAVMSGFTVGDAIELTAIGTGASLTSTTLGGNTVLTISGGSAEGTLSESFTFAGTSYAADYFTLSPTGALTVSASSTQASTLTVSSGQSAPADYTVSNGFTLDVLIGGSATNAQVLSGGMANFSGTDNTTTIANGGSISLTGTETGVIIQAGGTELIDAGTLTDGQIYGFQEVLSNTTGAAISNETIQNGGTLLVDNKSNTVTSTTVESGGLFAINGNASGNEIVIAGGVINLESPKANLTDLTFSGAGTLIESAVISAGTGGVFNAITGFGAGDVIDLASIGSGATLSTSVNSLSSETVVSIAGGTAEAGEVETFTFTGTGLDFQLAADTAGTGEALDLIYCYLPGTRILTPSGEVNVEALRLGDTVITRFSGAQTLKWIGLQRYAGRFLANNPEKLPVRIKAGALGQNLPVRDLWVSPGHSMLVGDNLLLAKNLVNGITILQEEAPELVEYYALELTGGHDCVIAEGAFSESFADGPGFRNQFHNAAEFYALFPDYREPDALVPLCAPRPEHGPELDAVLRPIVAQVTASTVPGELRGSIDLIEADGLIEGWAQDLANPELPVLLDIFVGELQMGSVLACNYREDLAEAGIGRGHAMFSFQAPVNLSLPARRAISIRRQGDGAALATLQYLRSRARG